MTYFYPMYYGGGEYGAIALYYACTLTDLGCSDCEWLVPGTWRLG
jgi:hypothetical protein